MKTLFLTLFFSILVVFCVAAGVLVAEIPPRTWKIESYKNYFLDRFETAALLLNDAAGPKVEKYLAEKLGQCELIPLPAIGSEDVIGNAAHVEGYAFFSRSIEVGKNALLCSFPEGGKPALLIPHQPANVTLRRSFHSSGSLELIETPRASFRLLSEALNFDVQVQGMKLHLESKSAISLNLEYDRAESILSLVVVKGSLDFFSEPTTNSPAPVVITLSPEKGATIANRGKVFHDQEVVRILPSGLYTGQVRDTPKLIPLPESSFLFSPLTLLPSGDPGTPERSLVELFSSALVDISSHDSLTALALYLPGIFPLHFLCQFTPSKGKSATVLPGEWVSAPAGGLLSCPGEYEINLASGTRLRVRQYGTLPAFHLAVGQAMVSSGANDYFLSTPGFSGGLRSHGKRLHISLSAKPEENVFDCVQGNVTVSLRTDLVQNSKNLFVNRFCRSEVLTGDSAKVRTLFPGDRAYISNLTIIRKYWPAVANTELPALSPDQGGLTPILLTAAAGGKVSWQLPSDLLNAGCALYSQKSDFSPLVEVEKVKGSTTGDAQLNKNALPSFASLQCESAAGTIFSNLVTVIP
jgi:hypothetical protein